MVSTRDFWEAKNMALSYSERAHSAVMLAKKYLPLDALQTVLDLGCGACFLKNHLPSETKYIPVDIASPYPETILCDLNIDPLPILQVKTTFMLGVFEYLTDCLRTLSELQSRTDYLILTYDIRKEVKKRANHCTHDQLREILKRSGWHLIQQHNFWFILESR